jgi:DNA helicase-2/ATP-dependent DNA helicase PcrA
VSDTSVRSALRSAARLVVVEAPAGCGKTHQGAEFARETALTGGPRRVLVLTHTHAACSMFAERTAGTGARLEIRTIDSIIAHIATAYHHGLGLPADTAAWVRQRKDGYAELATKVAALLRQYPIIAASLAQRYPVVICDEHQDSSGDQHAVVMALLRAGARVRVFADPMQRVFRQEGGVGSSPPCDWAELTGEADAFEQLDTPHRWVLGRPDLGAWTLKARAALKTGGTVDLRRDLPATVEVVFEENRAHRDRHYQLSPQDRKPVDAFEKGQSSLLILTRYTETGRSLRSFFNRRIPLWEGHVRDGLEKLVDKLRACEGDPAPVASAVVEFMKDVGKGFSASEFGNRLQEEVREGCSRKSAGKAARIQELGRLLAAEPDHRGVAKVLQRLAGLKEVDSAFRKIEVDNQKEFWEAVRLGNYESADEGLAEITHRRTYSRPKPPERAISTIHKAKGLECESVIVVPCDATTFPDKPEARCLLYVALSRAKCCLLLVVSRENPSPLLLV